MKKLLTTFLLVAIAVVVFLGSVVVKQQSRIQSLERQLGVRSVTATVHTSETREQFIARNEAKQREVERTAAEMLYSFERSGGADPQTAYERVMRSLNRPALKP